MAVFFRHCHMGLSLTYLLAKYIAVILVSPWQLAITFSGPYDVFVFRLDHPWKMWQEQLHIHSFSARVYVATFRKYLLPLKARWPPVRVSCQPSIGHSNSTISSTSPTCLLLNTCGSCFRKEHTWYTIRRPRMHASRSCCLLWSERCKVDCRNASGLGLLVS